jgi:hypothetical protein
VACSGCSSSSLVVAVLVAAAGPADAQSSHLTRLESAVPAIAPDQASAIATGGWVSAWLAPAAGHDVTGALAGLEHAGFAAVTTVFAAARIHLGLVWQVGFAQTRVSDLFDDALLSQYPELSTLRASATQLGLDAVLPLGGASAVGLGVLHEREEFLGDASRAWRIRVSAAGPRLLGIRSAAVVERMVSGGGPATAAGRLRFGVARPFGSKPVAVTVGLGAAAGKLWSAESGDWQVASSLRVTIMDLLTVSGALGAERDPFGYDGWLGFDAFGVGVTFGPVGADVRRGGLGAADAAPMAVSMVYQP